LREAKRQLEEQRAEQARPVPRSRGKRLKEASGAWMSSCEPRCALTAPTSTTAADA
jgi:hypothetical protein